MIKSGAMAFLFMLTPHMGHAEPFECPLAPSKEICLQAADETYQHGLEYLKEEGLTENEVLLDALNDVRQFEAIACQKTCL